MGYNLRRNRTQTDFFQSEPQGNPRRPRVRANQNTPNRDMRGINVVLRGLLDEVSARNRIQENRLDNHNARLVHLQNNQANQHAAVDVDRNRLGELFQRMNGFTQNSNAIVGRVGQLERQIVEIGQRVTDIGTRQDAQERMQININNRFPDLSFDLSLDI